MVIFILTSHLFKADNLLITTCKLIWNYQQIFRKITWSCSTHNKRYKSFLPFKILLKSFIKKESKHIQKGKIIWYQGLVGSIKYWPIRSILSRKSLMVISNLWIKRIHGFMDWWKIISNLFHNYQKQSQPKSPNTVIKMSNHQIKITIIYCQCQYGTFVTKRLLNYKKQEHKFNKLWNTIKILHKFNCGKKILINSKMYGKYIRPIDSLKIKNKIKSLLKGKIILSQMEEQEVLKETESYNLKIKSKKKLKLNPIKDYNYQLKKLNNHQNQDKQVQQEETSCNKKSSKK